MEQWSDFYGYERSDGRVGTRNHVLLLPLTPLANGLIQRASKRVPGTVSVRLDQEFQQWDNALTVFLGWLSHPNLFGCIVVTATMDDPLVHALRPLIPETARYEVIALASQPQTALERICRLASDRVRLAQQQKRSKSSWDHLLLGTECGGSDAFSGLTANPAVGQVSDLLIQLGGTSILAETPELIGAEHLLAGWTPDPQVRAMLLNIVARAEASAYAMGVDFRGTQPAPGNIQGGISSIEEKSLGCVHKGGASPLVEVLEYGHRPRRAGLVVMDTPGHDVMQLVGMVAGGAQIVTFTTGRGTPTGSAIAPVIKIATTTRMAERLADLIDISAGGVMDGSESLEDFSERLWHYVMDVANGLAVAAERHGHHEFAIFPGWGYQASRQMPRYGAEQLVPALEGPRLAANSHMVQISPQDTVGVALHDLPRGFRFTVNHDLVTLQDDVPMGHKVALSEMEAASPVVKYGSVIGYARLAIQPGQHVHTHNLESGRA